MTDALTLPLPTSPPSAPTDRVVYAALSTDHYPWTEVLGDLAVRQKRGWSGVLDAVQGPRWARFVWLEGRLLGGFTVGGQALDWAVTLAGLPRARVTLSEAAPMICELLWACRAVSPRPLPTAWPQARDGLERALFSGLLVSGAACSFWNAGRIAGGDLPASGAGGQTYALGLEGDREALVGFWQDLLRTIHHSAPLDDAWRQVTTRLSEDHPCLDPFAREITLQRGQLTVDPGLPVEEWRPALYLALRETLVRVGVRLGDLPLGDLPARPEWLAAGLGRMGRA
ncbi:hypothetical protein [Deinococcus aerophilus]|uniref:Uncharacterized protein n=1 Tax=Deinococcus aerophilus TaxID=522488 RepID=A0ABQ2GPV9_9DEIO|nr:hypothetical protein [Deinococcus aerophilus]GGM05426.1 hypothetical protein GCM10010841_12300 [Deinococcus aerophilus]